MRVAAIHLFTPTGIMQERGADLVIVAGFPLPLRAEVVGHAACAQLLENRRHSFSRVIGDIADDQTEVIAGVMAGS